MRDEEENEPWEAEGGAFQVGGVATGMPRTRRLRGLGEAQGSPGPAGRSPRPPAQDLPWPHRVGALRRRGGHSPGARSRDASCHLHPHVRTLAGNRPQRGRGPLPLAATASPPSATCSRAGSARPAGSPVAGDPVGMADSSAEGKRKRERFAGVERIRIHSDDINTKCGGVDTQQLTPEH